MSVPVKCSACGDVVGVTEGSFRRQRLGKFNDNAPCKGAHKPPKKTVHPGVLVDTVTVAYENESVSRYLTYTAPAGAWRRTLKKWCLRIYMAISRKDVFLEDTKEWLFV